MLNNFIKAAFAVIGFVTGFTLTRTVFYACTIEIDPGIKSLIYAIVSLSIAVLFYLITNKAINFSAKVLDRLELFIHNMTLYELFISSVGLIVGLVIANLISIPIVRVDVIGVPISIIVNILLGCLGIIIVNGKKNESFLEQFKDKKGTGKGKMQASEPKLLDTSVIIDGRIADVCRTGILEGDIIVPEFVLEELRHIADSADGLKRAKGRRGLDVLNLLQKELNIPVKVENLEGIVGAEVDDKLLKAARKFGAKVLTTDYNLNKVAAIQGVSVLNINELANALKPIAIPGEEMKIQVIKDGKENGQGIGYLDDGTMIVVEGGRRHIGEVVSVVVTSVLQTAAGRMIFAKPK